MRFLSGRTLVEARRAQEGGAWALAAAVTGAPLPPGPPGATNLPGDVNSVVLFPGSTTAGANGSLRIAAGEEAGRAAPCAGAWRAGVGQRSCLAASPPPPLAKRPAAAPLTRPPASRPGAGFAGVNVTQLFDPASGQLTNWLNLAIALHRPLLPPVTGVLAPSYEAALAAALAQARALGRPTAALAAAPLALAAQVGSA